MSENPTQGRRVRTTRHIDVVGSHIVSSPGVLGGKPRIKDHRISVQDIAIWHERLGKSADEIATEYALTLGQVHAALAYYFDHREEIDASIAADASLVQELRERYTSRRSPRHSV